MLRSISIFPGAGIETHLQSVLCPLSSSFSGFKDSLPIEKLGKEVVSLLFFFLFQRDFPWFFVTMRWRFFKVYVYHKTVRFVLASVSLPAQFSGRRMGGRDLDD